MDSYAIFFPCTWIGYHSSTKVVAVFQRPLAQLISVIREYKEGYAAIEGGSPLRKITDEQVDCGLSSVPFFFWLI